MKKDDFVSVGETSDPSGANMQDDFVLEAWVEYFRKNMMVKIDTFSNNFKRRIESLTNSFYECV